MSDEPNNLLSMAAIRGDAGLATPELTLREALQGLRTGELRASKLLVVTLDDGDGGYDVSFRQSGMRASEVVALCEVLKRKFLQMMDG